jgi:hypothetical protein
MSSREPPLKRSQPHQTIVFVPTPVLVPDQDATAMFPMSHGGLMPSFLAPPGMPILDTEASLMQPNPFPPCATPPRPEQKCAPAPEQKNHTDVAQSKQSRKAKSGKNEALCKDARVLENLSDDQKGALCKYIYDAMTAKKMTSSEGYLTVDVFSEVWKDLDASPEAKRVAQHRFLALLRAAPKYFQLFRKSIRVAGSCKSFSRKGQTMVSLVPEEQK